MSDEHGRRARQAARNGRSLAVTDHPARTTLLIGGAVLTIDPDRRLLDPGAVAVAGRDIVAVGAPGDLIARYPDAERVDLSHTIIMPGLIDSHGHAGHGLTKALADGTGSWLDLVEAIYFRAADEEFWRAESYLSALERLEFGVTTSLSMTGSAPRVDDARYAVAAAAGYADLGLRHIVALGPPNPPWPWHYRDVDRGQDIAVDLDRALATTAEAIDRLHGTADGRISCYVGPSSLVPEMADGQATPHALQQMRGVVEIARAKGVGIHAHAYAGQIAAAARALPEILTPRLSLAHCAGISLDEVRIMAETGVSASHGPLTHAFVRARFPVTEALEAGVNVAISTDGSAPDRSFDLLAQGRVAAQLQRAYFADDMIMPAGKILEMMTIDAARALGLEAEIGSLEPGKRADIIALTLNTARMAPRMMLPQRVAYVGSGLDVEFVMVDGAVRMRNRSVAGVDVDRILDDAERAAHRAIERAGVEGALQMPARLWRQARYGPTEG